MIKLILTSITVVGLLSGCSKVNTKNEKDDVRIKRITQGCKANDAAACLALVEKIRGKRNDSVILKHLPNFKEESTYAKAVKILKDECELSQAESCYKAGKHIKIKEKRSDKVRKQFENKPKIEMFQYLNRQAAVYYTKGCDLKHAKSCGGLWKSLKILSASDDELNAIGMKEGTYHAENCNVSVTTSSISCKRAASAYLLHVRTEQGFQLAYDIHEARCKNNIAYDCRQLVALYKSDKYGIKSKTMADKYTQKLCNMGHERHCN